MKYWILFAVMAVALSCNNSNKEGSNSDAETDEPEEIENSTSTGIIQNESSPDKPGVVPTAGTTNIEFEKVEHDFGSATEGDIVEYNYKFRNSGKEDLVISTVEASCGCTTPEWPKEPIKPGGVEYIKAKFNTDGKGGKNVKKITVIANTNPPHIELTLTGDVKTKK